jgi:regulatory protein
MKIQKIYKSRYSGKCFLYTDTGEKLELDLDLLVKYGITKGSEIDRELEKQLTRENRMMQVKAAAYRFASRSLKSRRQIIDNLRKKQFNDDEIENALGFLEKYDLIDDDKFAREFAASLKRRKSCGRLKIKNELLKKGIDYSIAEIVSKQYSDSGEDLKNAIMLAKRKLNLIKSRPTQSQKQALARHLSYKGFERSEIIAVLNKIFDN